MSTENALCVSLGLTALSGTDTVSSMFSYQVAPNLADHELDPIHNPDDVGNVAAVAALKRTDHTDLYTAALASSTAAVVLFGSSEPSAVTWTKLGSPHPYDAWEAVFGEDVRVGNPAGPAFSLKYLTEWVTSWAKWYSILRAEFFVELHGPLSPALLAAATATLPDYDVAPVPENPVPGWVGRKLLSPLWLALAQDTGYAPASPGRMFPNPLAGPGNRSYARIPALTSSITWFHPPGGMDPVEMQLSPGAGTTGQALGLPAQDGDYAHDLSAPGCFARATVATGVSTYNANKHVITATVPIALLQVSG